jgi:hypothetical protein
LHITLNSGITQSNIKSGWLAVGPDTVLNESSMVGLNENCTRFIAVSKPCELLKRATLIRGLPLWTIHPVADYGAFIFQPSRSITVRTGFPFAECWHGVKEKPRATRHRGFQTNGNSLCAGRRF